MDKAKLKLMEKLKKKEIDTEKKVNAIDLQAAFDNGFTTEELGGILALQKAIKTHSLYSYLQDGVDPKPAKKEAKHDQERSTGYGNGEGQGFGGQGF